MPTGWQKPTAVAEWGWQGTAREAEHQKAGHIQPRRRLRWRGPGGRKKSHGSRVQTAGGSPTAGSGRPDTSLNAPSHMIGRANPL
jgi:hypothetical protein